MCILLEVPTVVIRVMLTQIPQRESRDECVGRNNRDVLWPRASGLRKTATGRW